MQTNQQTTQIKNANKEHVVNLKVVDLAKHPYELRFAKINTREINTHRNAIDKTSNIYLHEARLLSYSVVFLFFTQPFLKQQPDIEKQFKKYQVLHTK